jgi:AbrB family looped-hinge helix DNA binding protein
MILGEQKMNTAFVNDARVMTKGQITIPKNVREALGVESGDRVTFIVDGSNVRVVNSAVYAIMRLQNQMRGEAEKAGLFSEEDVANWITQSRREEAVQ